MAANGMTFFWWGVGNTTTRVAVGKFEALSACQIMNERLMKCVAPTEKKRGRAHTFLCNFFQIIISCIM